MEFTNNALLSRLDVFAGFLLGTLLGVLLGSICSLLYCFAVLLANVRIGICRIDMSSWGVGFWVEVGLT